MEILDILKTKIEHMNEIILDLQNENESLKLELLNLNNENSYILKKNEHMISNIELTLKNISENDGQ